jgi:hypothetical protein
MSRPKFIVSDQRQEAFDMVSVDVREDEKLQSFVRFDDFSKGGFQKRIGRVTSSVDEDVSRWGGAVG